ncbi:hypothetical protein [Rhizobium leguminosarum]|uniref:Uncharacterized protein n=1 Tax=Rhizobium leguminosarum TaxID=384 RepID=A0A7X0DVE4_RHILE|nr:hypothetical protein [Rhizobium leguminosarum]MBB6224590.1 hypothetical protein [Rhizobium leguminosarum]
MFWDMATKYQPLYTWRGTKLDESDEPTDLDWLGYDEQIIIGRIRMESGGPKNGMWQMERPWPRCASKADAPPRLRSSTARLFERSRNTITG